MKKIILFSLVILIAAFVSNAQDTIRCGADEHLAKMLAADPTLQQRMDSIEYETQLWIANHPHYEMKYRITIPVVVHVVWYSGDPTENISDAQVQSQIDVLNEDYNRRNADSVNTPSYFKQYASSVPFDFCLASRDPAGNWTNGITRVETNIQCIGADTIKMPAFGGDTAWDPNSYLNIWVGCIGEGYLGIGQYPTGNLDYSDGVVVTTRAFGRGVYPDTLLSHYNLGRTTTHEVGHWLNDMHPWGMGGGSCCTCSDNCYDTPYQNGPTFGCPSGQQVSCNNGPNGDMYEVYMDYTDDACMNMFATCQTARMMAALNGVRQQFLNSNGCLMNGVSDMPNLKSLNIMPNPATDNLTLDINLMKTDNIKYSLINVLGSVVYTNSVGTSSGGKFYINTSHIPAGIYSLQLQLTKQTINQKVVIIR
jgi:hypothetical protein